MIRWCLYLRHLSSSAYETIRESGVFRLPSQRTLRDYTYHTQASIGFSADVDKLLMDIAQIATCPEREKYVLMLMDEMHIKEDIVYDKHTGTVIKKHTHTHTHTHTGSIIGFCNLVDINSHLIEFERKVEQPTKQLEELADHILVLMIRGLFSSL